MIAVDVNDAVKLHDAGLRVLNEGLGREAAQAFLSLSSDRRGNFFAERKEWPPMTEEEHKDMMDAIIADAKTRGEA